MITRPLFAFLSIFLLLMTGCQLAETPKDSVLIIESGDCLVTDLPYYGSASFPNDSLSLEYKLETTDSQDFELIIPDDKYGFFIYPAALGEATFFGGAWAGAAWEPYDPNSTATRNEPVVIIKDNTQWFVYRTDFPGGNRLLSNVQFSNEGLAVGDSSSCEVDGLKQGDESTFIFNLESAKKYIHPTADILPAPSTDNDNEICTMNALPIYGGIDLTRSARKSPSESLNDSAGQDFEITLAENEYGFFAYPAALGKADFFDRDFINARGGWHGATWASYDDVTFEEMSATTPIATEVAGNKWYVYRTDYPGLGKRKYAVRFENPSLNIGDEVSCDVSDTPFVEYLNLRIKLEDDAETEEPIPPVITPDLAGECTFSAMPRHGGRLKSIGLASEVLELEQEIDSLTDLKIDLRLTAPEYGVFAYPAALGEATFVEKNSGFSGSWDGATWDFGNIRELDGYSDRPLVTTVNGSSWFVYRTDFSELPDVSFSVTFANQHLSLGDTVGCDLAEYRQVSTGNVIGDGLTIVRIFVSGNTDELLEEGIVENGKWNINTSYFGVTDRETPDLAKFNVEGLYDLYFYSADETVYGPFPITVEDGEIINQNFDITQM